MGGKRRSLSGSDVFLASSFSFCLGASVKGCFLKSGYGTWMSEMLQRAHTHARVCVCLCVCACVRVHVCVSASIPVCNKVITLLTVCVSRSTSARRSVWTVL